MNERFFSNDVRSPRVDVGKLYVIPQNPNDHEFFLAVDRRTRIEVGEKFGVVVDHDWQCSTITKGMLDAIISQLGYLIKTTTAPELGMDFYELFNLIVTVKMNSMAEKEGNINISFTTGKVCEDLIANGPEDIVMTNIIDMFTTGDVQDDEIYLQIDGAARYNLSIQHGITFKTSQKFVVFAIGYTFIKNVYIELLYRLANLVKEEGDDSKERLISANFNSLIEFHGHIKDGEVSILMNKGARAKLLIKYDAARDNTMGT